MNLPSYGRRRSATILIAAAALAGMRLGVPTRCWVLGCALLHGQGQRELRQVDERGQLHVNWLWVFFRPSTRVRFAPFGPPRVATSRPSVAGPGRSRGFACHTPTFVGRRATASVGLPPNPRPDDHPAPSDLDTQLASEPAQTSSSTTSTHCGPRRSVVTSAHPGAHPLEDRERPARAGLSLSAAVVGC